MAATTVKKSGRMGFFKPEQNPALGNDKLKHLRHELKGSLFPMHTKLFAERIGVNSDPLKALIDDDIASIEKASVEMTRDDLKELLILAAFMGSNKIFNHLKESNAFILDEDVLNTAFLAGRFSVATLLDLSTEFRPGYGSIRFAIKSDKLSTVDCLMDNHSHLHFGSEHLTQAAAQGNSEIFDRIAATGVLPAGKFINSVSKSYPEIQERLSRMNDAATAGAGVANMGF